MKLPLKILLCSYDLSRSILSSLSSSLRFPSVPPSSSFPLCSSFILSLFLLFLVSLSLSSFLPLFFPFCFSSVLFFPYFLSLFPVLPFLSFFPSVLPLLISFVLSLTSCLPFSLLFFPSFSFFLLLFFPYFMFFFLSVLSLLRLSSSLFFPYFRPYLPLSVLPLRMWQRTSVTSVFVTYSHPHSTYLHFQVMDIFRWYKQLPPIFLPFSVLFLPPSSLPI